jgi:hypothetical protein
MSTRLASRRRDAQRRSTRILTINCCLKLSSLCCSDTIFSLLKEPFTAFCNLSHLLWRPSNFSFFRTLCKSVATRLQLLATATSSFSLVVRLRFNLFSWSDNFRQAFATRYLSVTVPNSSYSGSTPS